MDGSHIRILIMTFFFRYMRELILQGNLLCPTTLVFGKKGKQEKWAFTEEEQEDHIPMLSSDGEGRGVQYHALRV